MSDTEIGPPETEPVKPSLMRSKPFQVEMLESAFFHFLRDSPSGGLR